MGPPLEVRLRFRYLANWFLVFFALLVLLGAIITFSVSNYDSETDFIFRFYGVFNPCIFVDHYPANVFGLLAFSGMVYASMFFMVTLLLFVRNLPNAAQLSLTVGFFLAIHYIGDLLILDVFAANLYPHGDHILRDPAGGVIPLTGENIQNIKLHTFFYLLWLVGNLAAMYAVYRVRIRKPLSRVIKFLYALGALAILHSILNGIQWMVNWTNEGYLNNPDTAIQWVLKVLGYAKIAIFHPIAFLFFRHLMPAGSGVALTFQLDRGAPKETGTETETVDPDKWIGLAFRILGLSLLLVYLLKDPNAAADGDQSTRMVLLSGFRVAPFNFLFVPVLLLVGHAFCIGVLLTIARSRLMRGPGSRWTTGLKVTGGLMVFLTWTAFWLLIPELRTHGVQAIILMILFPMWVAFAFELNTRTIAFTVVWFAAIVVGITATSTTGEMLANLTLVVMLMFYNELMPGERHYPNLAVTSTNMEGPAPAP